MYQTTHESSHHSYSISSPSSSYFVRPPLMDLVEVRETLYQRPRNFLYEQSQDLSYGRPQQGHDDRVINIIDTSSVFLVKNPAPARFINTSKEIMEDVTKLVSLITGFHLPYDVEITVCSYQEMIQHYGKYHPHKPWSDTVRGFAVHANPKKIYVREDNLDRFMLTLGHEIGHILTPPRQNIVTEEAKAFAFELLWLETIQKHDVLGLSSYIDLQSVGTPAANGVHDVAFSWVNSFLMDGRSIKEVYDDLCQGEIIIYDDY